MPEKQTIERARRDKRRGKSSSTQAGEFVKETIDHIRQGKHGARSARQAIAIGLSKARRAGIDLPPPKKGSGSEATRKKAMADSKAGQRSPNSKPNPNRSQATTRALQREDTAAGSHRALSRQARESAKKRTSKERHDSAEKAVRTKGPAGLKRAAKKGAKTRAARTK